MRKERKYFVVEVKDEYWKARYDSETNELDLQYDTEKALRTSLHSLVLNLIQFKGDDVDRVIKLLQQVKKESNL